VESLHNTNILHTGDLVRINPNTSLPYFENRLAIVKLQDATYVVCYVQHNDRHMFSEHVFTIDELELLSRAKHIKNENSKV
jgi:hypothetical protein